jgi:ABC-2 type transport system ATP-binding protein
MDAVLADMRKHLQGEEIKIDHPRISLEEYFLNIIEKARKESVATSGVVGGGKIADYLSDEKTNVLDNLTQEAKSVKEDVYVAPVRPEVDKTQLLKELTGEKEKVDAAAVASKIKEEQRQAMEAADNKLDELLKDK